MRECSRVCVHVDLVINSSYLLTSISQFAFWATLSHSTDYPPPTIITGDDEHREIAKACSSRETGCYTLHQQGEQKTNEVHVV